MPRPTTLSGLGRPGSPGELAEAVFIGFDRSGRLLTRLNQMGLPLAKDNFRLTSENGAVAWPEMVKHGLGIGLHGGGRGEPDAGRRVLRVVGRLP